MGVAMLAGLVLAAAPAVSAHDLGWIVGDRVAADRQGAAEEAWIDGGDALLGVSATVRNGRTVDFEHLRIARDASGRLAYFAAPSGQPPAVFPLKSFDGRTAVFEDLRHDFPQRIVYSRGPNGAVKARIEGTIGGRLQAQDWTFRAKTPSR